MSVGHFSAIAEDECLELLRLRQVGRLGWVSDGLPNLLPITYLCTGRELSFRTSTSSPLAAITGPVVFEIDDIDEETRTGWSVVARGDIEVVDGTEGDQVEPWAPGVREERRRVTISSVSGRSVSQGSEGGLDAYA